MLFNDFLPMKSARNAGHVNKLGRNSISLPRWTGSDEIHKQIKNLIRLIKIWTPYITKFEGMCVLCRPFLLAYIGTIWLLMGEANYAAWPSSAANYWTRLNYGLAAVKVKEICKADGYVSHMFHIPLPKEEYEYGPRAANETVSMLDCDHLCSRMKAIPIAIQDLQNSMTNAISKMVEGIYQLVPDLDQLQRPSRRQQRKGLMDFVGQISSKMFGTAQLSDVEGLREQIKAIKEIACATAGDASSVREGLMTYTKTTGERLDAMHAVINKERTALRSLADQVRSISDSNYYEYNAIAIMGSEIAKFVELHDEVQTFKEGVADLLHGLLTSGLISLTEINAAITDMTQRLLSEKRGKMSML